MSSLKNALTSTFVALQHELWDAMDAVGEPRQDYHICIHPFAIERWDGNTISARLLRNIRTRLGYE